MTRWEYLIEKIAPFSGFQLRGKLQQYGKEGWELAAVWPTSTAQGMEYWAVFKCPVVEEQPDPQRQGAAMDDWCYRVLKTSIGASGLEKMLNSMKEKGGELVSATYCASSSPHFVVVHRLPAEFCRPKDEEDDAP